MVNLVFVVDTSASMNQRTSLGTTLLDVAKNAVETFIKIRQRDQASRTDRLMLVTLDEPPGSIKVGWNGTQPVFYNELRNLQASGLSTLGSALKDSFDLLNLYRLTSGIDNYGMGRKPFYLDPAIVVCITDGSNLSSKTEVERELHLPMHSNLPGSDLTKEPFRWDQRLFGVVLRMAGCRGGPQAKAINPILTSEPALAAMCEVTGGKCYKVSSSKSLGQALESIVQKIQCGIVVNFEKIGGPEPPQPSTAEGSKNNILRETDSPTPPPFIDGHNHIGNNSEALEELKNKQIKTENHTPIKTEGLSTSGTATPALTPRGDSLAIPPTMNGLPDESLALNGISRSATASPTPPVSQPASWTSCCRMIYIKANLEKDSLPTGYWPIPETFWPDPSMNKLAPRDAQPKILFNCVDSEPQVLENFPFDKYELEPSPLTQYILERKSPSTCWQTFIYNSGKKNGEIGHLGCTFGYLKASTNLQTVNLFVMPYNYPVLFPLVDELVKVHKNKPVPKWKQAFDAYLTTVPSYYAAPLRNAFRRMGIPTSLVPDHMDGALSFQILNYLKSVKQKSKIEAKRFEALMGKNSSREVKHKSIPSIPTPELPSPERKDYHSLLNHTAVGETKNKSPWQSDNDMSANEVIQAVKETNVTQPQSYKNPYDINRDELLDQLSRMRINFFHMAATSTILQEEDARHSIAISEMGNYGKVLRQGNQLREIDPGQNRAHMFGNPYKLAKDQRVMVDEADVNEAAKRKRPDTPPVKWPTSIHHDLPSPVPHYYREQQETLNNKPVINKENKDVVTNDIKANNLVPSHQRKRKPSEDISERSSESGIKAAKVTKHHIHPQLKKLQRLHQIKGQLPKKGQGLHNSSEITIGKNSCLNNVEKKQEVSDISSILRNALSTKDKNEAMGKESLQVTNTLDGLLNDERTSQSSTPSSSPSLVSQQQLIREAHEENSQIRTAIFKELRKHEKVDDEVLTLLGNLKGPPELQCTYLNEIIEEAVLFKKRILVTKLKSLLKKLQAGILPISNNCTNLLRSKQ